MRIRPVQALIAALVAIGFVSLRGHAAEKESAEDTFTMALAGDSIITRKLAAFHDPSFLKLVGIIRGADAAFTNLEMLLHDYEPYPMNESGGTWMRGDPSVAKELTWAGFDMVSRANNHAGDYGVEGLRLTTKYVHDAGLVQAGVGESLEEAREASFLETPKGRVALISVASTFPDHARASKARAGVRARPGLNPLRFTTTYEVPDANLAALRTLARDLHLGSGGAEAGNAAPNGPGLRFLNSRFVPGTQAAVHTAPLPQDLDEIGAVVHNASRMAQYTMVTIHAHEGAPGDRTTPAEFLVTFAHSMIDAGADVVAAHGPHIVRGIEIYKEKPILYSLGDFIFENDLVTRMPAEAYESVNLGSLAGVADFDDARSDHDKRSFPADREMWESIVAGLEWHGKTVTGLTLYPISLGFGQARPQRGRPVLAEPQLAKKIIDDISVRSKAFKTRITFQDGVGRVALTAAQPIESR